MIANAVVRARINGKIKEEAASVFAAMGLTISDAIRLMLIKAANDKVLPFNPLIPNKETIKAMKDARKGKMVNIGNAKNLLTELNNEKA